MPCSIPIVLLLALLAPRGIAGQALDQRMVPGGRVRVQAFSAFTGWEARFGPDGARIPLGNDLTSADAGDLFPGVETLADALAGLTGVPSYDPVLGSTQAFVSHEVTRIDIGFHIGVFDWLTIGVVAPRIKATTTVELAFLADTIAGDLGLNPVRSNALGTQTFLADLASAAAGARAWADQLCGGGAPECPSALALADRSEAVRSGLASAYGASPFFPLSGSTIATSVSQLLAALDGELLAVGLSGIPTPIAFATERVAAGGLGLVASDPQGTIAASPLESRAELWNWGDIEVSASVRLLEGGTASHFTYSLLGLGLLRLGTGLGPSPDVPLSLGTGDGQTDAEGRALGRLTFGSRLGLSFGALYGTQGPVTVVRRISPPDIVFAPISNRQDVRWSPADYWGVEVQPSIRVSETLAVAGEYRFFKKGEDGYAPAAGVLLPGGLDPVALVSGSGVTRQEAGISLLYDTIEPWRHGSVSRMLQLHGRLLHAFAGSGGRTAARDVPTG